MRRGIHAPDSEMRAARSGDAAAFERLLSPLLLPAYKLAFAMLAQREAAEDAVQEAAFKAWRGVGSVRTEGESIRPWFLTIVANQCRMTRRSRWWRTVLIPEPTDNSHLFGTTGERLEDRTDTAHDLRRAVGQLSNDKRLVLTLVFGLDLPLAETGRILGISPQAARSRLHRAVVALRSQIRTEESLSQPHREPLHVPPEVST